MNNTLKNLSALGLIGASGAWLLRSRAAQWKSETDAMIEAVEYDATASSDLVSFRDFDDLPAPVAAYFRFALKDGQQRIRTATIRHEGQFVKDHPHSALRI